MSTPDEPESENPTGGLPTIVLACGIMTTVFGVGTALIHLRHPIDGILGFIIPVIVLGVGLIGIWVKWKVRGELGPPFKVGEVPTNVPGPWYPVAILAIAVALLVWIKVWTKL